MKTLPAFVLSAGLAMSAALLAGGGCEEKPKAPVITPPSSSAPSTPSTASSAKSDDHDHDHDHDHKPGEEHDHGDDEHGHGPTTELGEQMIGGFTVKASRDGAITPGGDAPIDAWVTGGTAKVAAVRFWVGTQDGKGSVKAKAELEKDNWHTHIEVPKPLPEGSKLWVEIETDAGEKVVSGFELKL